MWCWWNIPEMRRGGGKFSLLFFSSSVSLTVKKGSGGAVFYCLYYHFASCLYGSFYLASPRLATLVCRVCKKLARVQGNPTFSKKTKKTTKQQAHAVTSSSTSEPGNRTKTHVCCDWIQNITQNRVACSCFPSFSLRCIYFFFHFGSQNCADGAPFNHGSNPKTRKNLIDYWNGDMNGPYKMPLVVGGWGAQREEVFSIIHLPLHCFMLRCWKTALTTASFDPSEYYAPARIPSYSTPVTRELKSDSKITFFKVDIRRLRSSLFGRCFWRGSRIAGWDGAEKWIQEPLCCRTDWRN